MMISSISNNAYGSFDRASMAAQMFKKMDVNEDGGLDASELEELAAHGEASAEELLSRFDSDGDGVISESENAAAMEKSEPPTAMGEAAAVDMSGLLNELMAKFDANSDGSLDEEETSALLAAAPEGSSSSQSEALSAFDSDGDGVLNEDEVSSLMQSMAPPPPPPSEASGESSVSELFSAMDADGDGAITESEMQAHVSAFQASVNGTGQEGSSSWSSETLSQEFLYTQMQRGMLGIDSLLAEA